MTLRFRVSLTVAAVVVTLPGCVTGSWNTPAEPANIRTRPVATEPARPAKTTRFADVLRTPGQHVPLHGPPIADPPQPAPPAPVVEYPPREAAKPAPPDSPLVAAVREYAAGRSGADHLRQLDPAVYEHLAQLLPAVVKLSQTPAAQLPPNDAAEVMKQFDPTLAVVARRAPLRIEKAVFCKDVKAYGKFRPLPDGVAFEPGKIYVLYLEIGNVPNDADTRDGASGFSTRLACRVHVKDESGRAVELADEGRKAGESLLQRVKEDFSRSPVRDYFAVFWFSAPSKPGTYTVTFEVRDPATARAVSKSLSFRVQ
jgi:hypothetical protein